MSALLRDYCILHVFGILWSNKTICIFKKIDSIRGVNVWIRKHQMKQDFQSYPEEVIQKRKSMVKESMVEGHTICPSHCWSNKLRFGNNTWLPISAFVWICISDGSHMQPNPKQLVKRMVRCPAVLYHGAIVASLSKSKLYLVQLPYSSLFARYVLGHPKNSFIPFYIIQHH